MWLCGELRVELDGRRAERELPARQGRLLFAYLVLHRGRAMRRDALVDALWPQRPPRDPEAALNSVLARLRRVVGHERLPARGPVRLLLGDEAWIDVEAAQAAATEARAALEGEQPDRALELASEALGIIDQPLLAEFEREWLDERRRALADRVAPLVDIAAEAAVALGGAALDRAELLARGGVEREPFRESTHAALMRVLAAKGDSAEALRVYDALRVRLRHELGASPSRALQALHQRLLTDAPAPAPGTPATPPPDDSPAAPARPAHRARAIRQEAPEWPLVSREDALQRVLGAARDPAERGLVLSGPAGVGKTRLLRRAVDALARAGIAQPHWVQASESAATIPFGAVAHLLVDSDAATSQTVTLARTRARLLERAAGAGGDGNGSLVLAVDDVHLLDAASAALIGVLVASATGTVLLTVRSGHSAPDAVGVLIRNETFQRLELQALSPDAVGDVLAQALGGQVAASAAHEFSRLSGGNPLLLRELVSGARLSGALRERNGVWRLVDRLGSATGFDAVVGVRLGQLDAEGQELACLLALGEPLEAMLLDSLTSNAGRRAIERAGLIDAVPDVNGRRQHVRLVHPLYTEALRRSVAPLQARTLYGQLADALQATGARRRGDRLRLAAWLLDAGRSGDPDAFLEAAQRALAAFDHPLAERLARAALQAGAGFPARLALETALRWQGRTDEAEELLADWQTEAGTDAQRVQAVSALTTAVTPPDRIAAVLTEADALVRDPDARRRLRVMQAEHQLLVQWRVRDALRTIEPLLGSGERATGSWPEALEIVLAAGTLAGRSEWALATAQPALDALKDREDHESLVLANGLMEWSCLAHAFAGRLVHAQELAAEGHRRTLAEGMPQLQLTWAVMSAEIALLQGQVATACRWAREAATLLPDWHGAATLTLGCLAEAASLRGEVADAEKALAEACRSPAMPAHAPLATRERARTWLTAARGELTAARQLAAGAADTQRETGAHAFEALALHDVVRLGGSDEELTHAAQRLHELAQRAEGHLIPALASHARALSDHNTHGLELASAELERLGAVLYAAEAAAQLSQLCRETGQQRSADTAARRAAALAEHCEGARTPALTLAEPVRR